LLVLVVINVNFQLILLSKFRALFKILLIISYLIFLHADLIMRTKVQSSTFYEYNLHTIRFLFGEHKYYITKGWMDLNYRMIRSLTKRQFLLRCKHNHIFPSHLTHINEKRFHFTHYKSLSKLESALQRFKVTLLNIEIFDVHYLLTFGMISIITISVLSTIFTSNYN